MLDNDDILAELRGIRAVLESDEYEYSDPYTIGGTTGDYQVASPYNTECEWTLVSATSSLANDASFVIGSKNPKQPQLALNGNDSFGAVSAGKDGNALPAYAGHLTTANTIITYPVIWMPLPAPTNVFMHAAVGAGSEILVTVQFRRKLERYIPDAGRNAPKTIGHPNHRHYRTAGRAHDDRYAYSDNSNGGHPR